MKLVKITLEITPEVPSDYRIIKLRVQTAHNIYTTQQTMQESYLVSTYDYVIERLSREMKEYLLGEDEKKEDPT